MNRLSPLVRRRYRPRDTFPAAAAAVQPRADMDLAARWVEDAKTFAGGWVAGLVIFGTLFG